MDKYDREGRKQRRYVLGSKFPFEQLGPNPLSRIVDIVEHLLELSH